MKDLFERRFTILKPEADAFLTCRPDILQMHMQQIAGMHSDVSGDSLDEYQIWIIARGRIDMLKYPVAGETYAMRTNFAGMDGPFYMRSYEMVSEAGEKLGGGSSAWLVIQADTRRVMRPQQLAQRIYVEPGKLPMVRLEKIVHSGGIPNACMTRKVCYSDVDINGHMNNTRYCAWIMDCFPMTHHEQYHMSSLFIQYSQEALPGDEVVLSVADEDGGHYINGCADGHKCFEARVQWAKR